MSLSYTLKAEKRASFLSLLARLLALWLRTPLFPSLACPRLVHCGAGLLRRDGTVPSWALVTTTWNGSKGVQIRGFTVDRHNVYTVHALG